MTALEAGVAIGVVAFIAIILTLHERAKTMREIIASENPYRDFDLWQQAFHAGLEARQSGLDAEDSPFLVGSRDYTAWLDGYIIAGKHGADPCAREVA